MFDFFYSHGGARRKAFKVKGEVCMIGSARSNDLVLETKAMGKRHAELRLLPSGVHITDLGSMAGTWVNKERVTEYGPISDLDEIVIGDVSLVLDGMPVISDDLVNSTTTSSNDARHGDAARSLENYEEYEEEPKPKKGGLFSLFSSRNSNDQDDDQDDEELEALKLRRQQARNGSAKTAAAPSTENAAVAQQASAEQHSTATNAAAVTADLANGVSPQRATVTEPTAQQPVRGTEADVEPQPKPQKEPPQEPESVFSEQDREIAYWSRIVHDQLLDQMDLRRKDVSRMSDDQLREESESLISRIVESLDSQMPEHVDVDVLKQNVLNEAVGLGPLEKFLEDDDVTEVMVNNHAEIFLEKSGKIIRSKNQFSSDLSLIHI